MANKTKKKASNAGSNIAENRRARHDYFIENTMAAGMVLQGWEVKSLRDGRANIAESYVMLRDGEVWLTGAHFSPLLSASTHVDHDPVRIRKLLLNKAEIRTLIGAVERKGYTLVALRLFWSHGFAKLAIGLARGKKQHDKRASEKERDWNREKQRVLRVH